MVYFVKKLVSADKGFSLNEFDDMKKKSGFTILIILCFVNTWAQHNVFSVGSTRTLTIKSGTVFSADSLVLTPASDFSIVSNAVLETPVPSPGYPNGTIQRVYYLNSPLTFTGNMQIYYQLSELNGNTESQLAYSDSTVGSWWLISNTGFVNTASHFVQYPASAHSFIAATAAQIGDVLLLKLISFTGQWDGDHVRLDWIVDQNEDSKDFTVETSYDQQSWKTLNIIPGSLIAGEYRYSMNDYDAAFVTKLYRIKITELSGEISYSPVIKINKGSGANNMYITAKNGGATIYFTGMQPKAVRVFNAGGQMIWTTNTSQSRYDLNNLLPGAYFVQYELNGMRGARQFIVK